MTTFADLLMPIVRPRYIVDVEKRVYLERIDLSTPVQSLVADAAIYHRFDHLDLNVSGGATVLSEPSIIPKVCTIPYFEEHRETFLTIRRGSPSEVVTVIELLSPTNKRKGSVGLEHYVAKFQELMKTKANLVELDLLRGGERWSLSNPPDGDYFAMVSKSKHRLSDEPFGNQHKDIFQGRILVAEGSHSDASLDQLLHQVCQTGIVRFQFCGRSIAVDLNSSQSGTASKN